MKRFKNILLIADSKTNWKITLNRAAALAKKNRAKLIVAEVTESLPRDMQILLTAKHLAHIGNLIFQDRLEQLENLIKPIQRKGIDVAAKVLRGVPFIEIIREVLRNRHDLVMITVEKKSGLKGMLYGTTTMHVMRKCPCPVWAIKSTECAKYAKILAAVDPIPSDEVSSNLNAKILQLAYSLARLEKAKLHVIHTWKQHGESFLRHLHRMGGKQVHQVIHQTRKMHKERLDELLKAYAPGMPKEQVYLLQGEAGTLIPQVVKKKRIELTVMGTLARTGIPGMFIGNTAERILQQVNCSILAIKPDGFISPVKLD